MTTAMLRFLLIAVAVIGAIVVCVLAIAATKPARFTVKRSITIQSPPERVFALINDLHHWPEWSVDTQGDQNIKLSYSGTMSGSGAICMWEGTGKSGKVRLEIMEANPGLVRVQADWERPFVARNINLFIFDREGTGTQVTWSLDGQNVFALKVMTVFVSADKVMGSHLEKNLAALKTTAEK